MSMADKKVITNKVLLQHIQDMKNDLQQQINRLDQKVDRGFVEVHVRFAEVARKFEEARQHRQALQEDLDATIRLVSKHEVKLARR